MFARLTMVAFLSVVALSMPFGLIVEANALPTRTPTKVPTRTPTKRPTPTRTPTRTPTKRPTPTPTPVAVLSGQAIQGVMAGAQIKAFAVNTSTGLNGGLLGSTTADSMGKFTIKVSPPFSGPVRLRATGTFNSEMDGAKIAAASTISALIASGAKSVSGISINPLAEFVSSLTIGKLSAGGMTFSTAFAAARTTIQSLYGLTNDPAKIVPSYSAGAVGGNSGNLALALGAIINEDQQECRSAPGGLAAALSADIYDGIFNGKKSGVAIPYCGRNLAATAGITGFQDALSGLAQLQDPQRAFAFGGTGNLLTTNGVADIALNGTHVYPLAPLALINTGVLKAAPAPANKFAPSASTGLMNAVRSGATATLLPNGKVLIAGGDSSTSTGLPLASTELYDPVTNTFAPAASTAKMNVERVEASATLLPNGKVLIAGGFSNHADGVTPLSTELYDPVTNTFAPVASTAKMNVGRASATATLLPNGEVLIAGGQSAGFISVLASTELYDPVTNTFAAKANTAVMKKSRRQLATATLLPNGKVLIAGGAQDPDGRVALGSTELYDPATNTFATTTPHMNTERAGAMASLLPNGKVLIAGGVSNCCYQQTTELYDAASNSFAPPASTATMNGFHAAGTATLIPNGKVLIAGDFVLGNKSSDLYDPPTNAFAAAASTAKMNTGRSTATATLLPNGKVLIAGGNSSSSNTPIKSTELYTP